MGFDPGTAAMMAIPGVLSLVSGLTGNKAKQGSTFSKGARSAIDDVLQSIKGMKNGAIDVTQQPGYQQGQEWLSSLFNDPEFFNKFEAPLQRQFQEQTVPDLANRFASMGSGGALGSTGFRNQLAREGSNLSTNIAALRGGMQQQGVNQGLQFAQQPFQNLMSLYGIGTQPTMNQYQPASPGFGSNIASAMFGGLSQGYGQYMGQNMANTQQQSNFQPQGMFRGYPGQSPSTY